jgi:hypothetical protein
VRLSLAACGPSQARAAALFPTSSADVVSDRSTSISTKLQARQDKMEELAAVQALLQKLQVGVETGALLGSQPSHVLIGATCIVGGAVSVRQKARRTT